MEGTLLAWLLLFILGPTTEMMTKCDKRDNPKIFLLSIYLLNTNREL